MKIKVTENIPEHVAKNIFDVLDILKEVGVPFEGLTQLRLQRMAQACMAIGQIKQSFDEVKSLKDDEFLRTREILKFENEYYNECISPGSYDDIRRKDLKLLVLAHIAINSSMVLSKATNDGSRGYCLSDEFADLIKNFRTEKWKESIANYKTNFSSLKERLEKKRNAEKIPVVLPSGKELLLSCGKHNALQKAIVENFLAIFGKGCKILYLGDTCNKFLYIDEEELGKLRFFELKHEELPDVLAYNEEKNMLFLIEAYHCTGQWNKARLYQIKEKLVGCKANLVFVSAFETIEQFRTKSNDIAWETEVWIADMPEHMIHFNGWKFLEIHK